MGDVLGRPNRMAPWSGFLDPHDQARQRGFSTAAFADQPDRLAAANLEIDAVHGMHRPGLAEQSFARQREVLDQTAHLQQRCSDSTHAAAKPAMDAWGSAVRTPEAVLRDGNTPPSWVTQHRVLRPGATSVSWGCSVHFATRNGQRSAKRHPVGQFSGSGGVPSMVVSRFSPGVCRSSRGTALISAQV